jgi:hypothetical protein
MQANRPAPRFQTGQTVWNPADTKGTIIGRTWVDGAWVYQLDFGPRYRRQLRSYAEHELTEANR